MISIYLFMAFFIANLLGYGGGPASIPLMFEEVVNRYSWLSNDQFSNMLALANALPGPIATKIGAYVGYSAGGWPGFLIALIATVVPSALALIVLFAHHPALPPITCHQRHDAVRPACHSGHDAHSYLANRRRRHQSDRLDPIDCDCGDLPPCHDKIQDASGVPDYRGVFVWRPCDSSFIETSTWTGACLFWPRNAV